MKRFTAFLLIIVLAALGGCALMRDRTSRTSFPTDSPQMPTVTPGLKQSPVDAVIEYTSINLGIRFSMPGYWKGKYTVEENEDSVLVYFKPSVPAQDYDGFLFIIQKRTPENQEDAEFMDGYREVKVNGVTYMCGGPTDVTYEGPEFELFNEMNSDVFDIYGSIRGI